MSKRHAELMYLQYFPPGGHHRNIAILLLDRAENILLTRFTENWTGFDDFELEIFSALGEDLHAKAREFGAAVLVDYLQGTLSNALRITDSQSIVVDDLEAELERLTAELLEMPSSKQATGAAPQSWTAAYHAAVPRGLIVAGEIVRACQHSRLDLTYAAGSALCLLVLLVISANLFQSTKFASPSVARTGTTRSFEMQNVAIDNDSRAALIAPELPVSSTSAPRRPQKRRRIRLSVEKVVTAIASRPFIAPHQTARMPQVSMMTPVQIIPVLTTPTTSEDVRLVAEGPSLPPLPPERVRGVRRLLHAVAFPFKKIGAGFAN